MAPDDIGSEPSALERILRRDRHIVIGGLVFVSLTSWLWILTGAGTDMGEMAATPGGATLLVAGHVGFAPLSGLRNLVPSPFAYDAQPTSREQP